VDLGNVVKLVVLIVVLYLAFRVGAFLMKLALGLVALFLLWYLVSGLLGATP
jgi:hypothetical protein